MVAHATRAQDSFSGLRPINTIRDLVEVADLIERAFADDMDESGRRAVREMRWFGRLGFLFGWLDTLNGPGQGIIPGFVWIEDGHVMGNATVRRLSMFGRGWMIGNVAVAPEWRGRGIARSLMNASVESAGQQNADWIALQVRSDNTIARNLYASMGFQAVGETIDFQRTAPDRVARPDQLVEGRLRAARPEDTDHIFALAQASISEAMRWAEPVHRSAFELGLERRLSDWLTGTQSVWRVVEAGGQVRGVAMAQAGRWSHRGQLRVWVAPSQQGRIEQTLVDAVLAELKPPVGPIMARITGQAADARAALEARGFKQVRALTYMRLTVQAVKRI